MKYEEAMSKSELGFVVTRKGWHGKDVTGSGPDADGSHPPVMREKAPDSEEVTVTPYAPTDEDKAAEDWSVL
jgi:hypothetical protein